jgi:SNF2 family DNA or RNA helicase
MGKTVIVLNALQYLSMVEDVFPALVLAPLRVARRTWSDEAAKWSHLRHLRMSRITGGQFARRTAMSRPAEIYTTNYENLPWLIQQHGDDWPYRTVIADEATRLKSMRASVRVSKTGKRYVAAHGGMRARALAKLAHFKVVRFWELTGTPSPNGLKDLWGQLWFLDAGQRLGRTYDAFSHRWFEKGYNGFELKPRAGAQEEIHSRIKDICLSLRAEDWFELDAPISRTIYVDLPAVARKRYRELEKQMFTRIQERTVEALNPAALTQKCLQLANGACYVNDEGDETTNKEWRVVHDEKLAALESIISESGGAPIMVAYQFRSDLARLLKTFPQGRALVTKKDEDDFRAGRIPLLFVHPKSAGHGIDGFQNPCNELVFFGHDWNLEEYQQIIERIGPVRQRQSGLNRPVFLYHIVARDTLDEDVMARRLSKKSVQDLLLDAMRRRFG